MQFSVRENASVVTWIVGLKNQCGLVSAGVEVAVKAILGNVELRATEPFYPRFLKIPFKHLVPFALPAKVLGYAAPKCFGILGRSLACSHILVVGANLVRVIHRYKLGNV